MPGGRPRKDPSNPKPSKPRINTTGSDARTRIVEAVRLRVGGMSYMEIALKLGFKTAKGAHEAVRRSLEDQSREAGAELLDIELARLDRMLVGQLPKIDRGDPKGVEWSIKIMERMARYSGLDRTYAYVPPSGSAAPSELPSDPAERQAVIDAWVARTRATPSSPAPATTPEPEPDE